MGSVILKTEKTVGALHGEAGLGRSALDGENESGRHEYLKRFVSVSRQSADELSVFDGFPPTTGHVLGQMSFGGLDFCDPAKTRMQGADWPMLWLQGDVCPGVHVAGTQALVREGVESKKIVLDGRVVGSSWSDDEADYALLLGVLPASLTATRGAQTFSCFEQMEAALAHIGMDFSHVVRTWLYLDGLLSWYDEFNVARTEFFQTRGVFKRLIPASTGIGARNPAGAALTAGVLAIRPKSEQVKVIEVISPLQCSATDYRSSFSRAVEVITTERRLLMISGTASIAPDGRSLHGEDIGKQIHLTLDVVEAILHSRDMNWLSVSRAIGYFYDIGHLPVFEHCCRTRGIPVLPLIPAHATICRSDLLFEIELDAVALHR